MAGVTVIVPTGGRPQALKLCYGYILRQTWRNPLQVIVVDDGAEQTAYSELARDDITYTLIRPEPFWQSGQNTLARNLLAAIPEVQHEYVLIAEDDDHYPADYIEQMAAALNYAVIVGCAESRYYNVRERWYRTLSHPGRSSLCHTGFRRELLPALDKICQAQSQYIDVDLWAALDPSMRGFVPSLCTGIKGLPGRLGIGIGHQPVRCAEWKHDPDLAVLRQWIGDDADLYIPRAAIS